MTLAMTRLLIVLSLLIPASFASAQATELGDPELPRAEPEPMPHPDQTPRESRRRERLTQAAGSLLLLSRREQREERAAAGREMVTPAIMTGVGAASVIGGVVTSLLSLSCTSGGPWSIGPSCQSDGAVLATGLALGGAGAISLIIGAIWLRIVDRRRGILDWVLEQDAVSIGLSADRDGGGASVAVAF